MMAGNTNTHYDIARIKRDHSLASIASASGVRLRRVGRDKLTGCCPFHDDHRPSLLIDEHDHHFHCFACKAHGDVIDFVMRREQLSFNDACDRLNRLPRRAVHYQPRESSIREGRRWDRLGLDQQVVMNTACTVYHFRLWQEPSVLTYLHDRGIPNWVIRACALGYADGSSLETFLRRRSDLRVAQKLGLLRAPKHAYEAQPLREFLAHRIVVPEIRAGQCIWFIGRSLDNDPHRPKYLVLPSERPVLGMERVVRQREVFLCEGVFDYLTAVKWKLTAFTPCGTHLPTERLKFLAHADIVYGVLDGDDAGRKSAERFGQLFGDRWRPIQLPDGCDMNDLGRRPGGRAEFFRLIAATHSRL